MAPLGPGDPCRERTAGVGGKGVEREGWGTLAYLCTFLCHHPWGSLGSGGALGAGESVSAPQQPPCPPSGLW